MRIPFLGASILFWMLFSVSLLAQWSGVIADRDGYTNVRAGQSASAKIVARVREGEVFKLAPNQVAFADWLKVSLKSGASGWIHHSRIRLYVQACDIQDGGPHDEVNIYASRNGISYYALARLAVGGRDRDAMHTYFSFRGDGAAAETHAFVAPRVLHLAGDSNMAAFLRMEKSSWRREFLSWFDQGDLLWPFEPREYLRRCFPQSAALLGLK